MKKILSLTFIFCFFLTVSGFTDELTDEMVDSFFKEVYNNVSNECVTCAAFYFIAEEAFRRSGYTEDADQFKELAGAALMGALKSAKEGRTQEMAEKVTQARLELNVKEMRDETGNSLDNISILINKHGARCKDLMANPEDIMQEWTEKIFNRHGYSVEGLSPESMPD